MIGGGWQGTRLSSQPSTDLRFAQDRHDYAPVSYIAHVDARAGPWLINGPDQLVSLAVRDDNGCRNETVSQIATTTRMAAARVPTASGGSGHPTASRVASSAIPARCDRGGHPAVAHLNVRQPRRKTSGPPARRSIAAVVVCPNGRARMV